MCCTVVMGWGAISIIAWAATTIAAGLNLKWNFICELSALLKTDAIKQVPHKPHYISSLKCGPQKVWQCKIRTYYWSEIVDWMYWCPNISIWQYRECLWNCQVTWFFSPFDLKTFFHHTPEHFDFQEYLDFSWQNKHFFWCVLPFGHNISPYFFNECLKPVVHYMREQGVRIVLYVDNTMLLVFLY